MKLKQQTVRLSRRTLTDPPYLVGFRDRSGCTIAGDVNDDWLQPASNEMYRVLKKEALMVSFYGWHRIDRFMAAWKRAGFSVGGHLVFTKNYTSKSAYVAYRHECAYILAKGSPARPRKPLPDVLGWKYSGNRHHPTEKPVTSLQPLIESFTHPNAIVLDPSAGTGAILRAIRDTAPGAMCDAVEINSGLVRYLRDNFNGVRVQCCDFMEWQPVQYYSRIIMNPPFSHGQDIRHILRAFSLLRPGGVLVAVCLNGPRQQERLLPFSDVREELPRGTFAYTDVPTMIIRLRA
ncbi:class I SAM-dependent methyltransferase [Escherichia coli]|nr:class I SAM-dependent methyltransferase [Escherichia coli]EEU4687244.1 class I SAM-dependent methyltransferase [Escherichia coli]EEV0712978.1 class I SAM-dependent methyltransferase [Escherichia coli]EEV7679759.1 class I SAM-dependent methyltransferase [Escherichia coli]EEZ5177255.1 class I SAM-dependent methyltransferase [Escherichia coli]